MAIRSAENGDLSRIAEIFVFNNRINYYPIFKDASFSFGELQVLSFIDQVLKKEEVFNHLFVFDEGLIKGFIQINAHEIVKLYVDPFFQNEGIGHQLICYALSNFQIDHLWALEKNARAIAFYQKHGFYLTGKRKLEEGTNEYLVLLRNSRNSFKLSAES